MSPGKQSCSEGDDLVFCVFPEGYLAKKLGTDWWDLQAPRQRSDLSRGRSALRGNDPPCFDWWFREIILPNLPLPLFLCEEFITKVILRVQIFADLLESTSESSFSKGLLWESPSNP